MTRCILTLLAPLVKGVEEHLEGGWVAESREDLHGCGLREETFPSVHCLKRQEGRGFSTRPKSTCQKNTVITTAQTTIWTFLGVLVRQPREFWLKTIYFLLKRSIYHLNLLACNLHRSVDFPIQTYSPSQNVTFRLV